MIICWRSCSRLRGDRAVVNRVADAQHDAADQLRLDLLFQHRLAAEQRAAPTQSTAGAAPSPNGAAACTSIRRLLPKLVEQHVNRTDGPDAARRAGRARAKVFKKFNSNGFALPPSSRSSKPIFCSGSTTIEFNTASNCGSLSSKIDDEAVQLGHHRSACLAAARRHPAAPGHRPWPPAAPTSKFFERRVRAGRGFGHGLLYALAVEKGDRHFAATLKLRENHPVAQSQSPFSTGC